MEFIRTIAVDVWLPDLLEKIIKLMFIKLYNDDKIGELQVFTFKDLGEQCEITLSQKSPELNLSYKADKLYDVPDQDVYIVAKDGFRVIMFSNEYDAYMPGDECSKTY